MIAALPHSASNAGAEPPPQLPAYRGRHAGETILVCGCGSSLATLRHPERYLTIGVNDVGRLFQPDYLVVINPRHQFHGDRFRHVEESRARAIFTHLDLGIRHPRVVRFSLGKRGGVDFSNPNILHYTANSPYVAMCLAVHMGARRIGLIGVDFTDHHFFARTGTHPLQPQLPQIDAEYKRLYEACGRVGIEVFNLSPSSRVTAFPKLSLDEFADSGSEQPVSSEAGPLSIVSYATTPVAGVPAVLARSIAASTRHDCRTVWATNSYGNGVTFDGDVEWHRAPSQAESLLESAALVIVHNGKIDPRHRRLLAGKPVVTMAHNYLWNVDASFVEQGYPGVVVGQYQATLPEFKGWQPVPNPVPLWESAFQPASKPAAITICYTPSGKHESYPPSHRLYWHSKGFDTTMRVLDRLERECGIHLEVTRGGQVSHTESLAMKRRSHIVIDECVTGSYHRNSLEGLAAGCVVINGVGLLPGVQDVFRLCSGTSEIPFEFAGLAELESVLRSLIAQGAERLTAAGQNNRRWMERHWNFGRQWEQFWEPVVERAQARAGRKISQARPSPVEIEPHGEKNMGRETVTRELKPGLSVVICQGGKDRLAHLSTSLANLRQCDGIDETVVVDMGDSPWAEEIARRWADKYVFIPNQDVFERARSLNTGTALTTRDLVIWKDNDLLVPSGFFTNAVTEMRSRQLDFLIPYSAIHYLSAPDTRLVMQGIRNPEDCQPANVHRPVANNCGAMGMVRRSFLLTVGGMSEEFRGWGGEDDAWWHKVKLLGRAAVSQRQDQILYHLYHEHSGGNPGGGPYASNPYYKQNVQLLGRMRGVRSRQAFLKQFPPPATLSRVWEKRRILFIEKSPAGHVRDALAELFGFCVDCCTGEPDASGWLVSILARDPEAVILSDPDLAAQLLSDERAAGLWPKTIVILSRLDPPADAPAILERAAALIPAKTNTGLETALALIPPLSLILAGVPARQNSIPGQVDAPPAPQVENTRPAGPVWLYWEGECPEWIKQCRQTVLAHARDVRLLSTEEFDRLRTADRDIDLSKLQIAHRADYVRAYLLKHHGGIWIDSDCILMQSLDSVLGLLAEYDLVAHRERSGYVSNAFLASRPNGVIVSELYRRICALLRSHRPIGWISLGGEPLTEILKSTPAPWHELECERVQPVCWSHPETFFARKDSQEHGSAFSPQAICYMLSNTEFRRYQAATPSADLLAEDTFFRYLIDRSLGKGTPPEPPAAASWRQVPFCLEAISDLRPKRIVDVGTGAGRWGMLLREFSEPANGLSEASPLHIERIEPSDGTVPDGQARPFYNRIRTVNGDHNLAGQMEGQWDLALVSDVLHDRPEESGRSLLSKALETAHYVLVNTPVTAGPPAWVMPECLANNPIRYAVFGGGQDYASFLLSRGDPKGLRPVVPSEEIFSRHIDLYSRQGDESVSGPGSSLYSTAEIRQRLPLLLQDLSVRSLLDAPCGDFNWMRTLYLALNQYTGVDLIPSLIEQNQRKYGTPNRQFLAADLTHAPLPSSDLVLCRDLLPHLSFQDVFRVIRNFARSGSRYLLATHFEKLTRNAEISTGEWRPINLQLAPFHFPTPLRVINEKCKEGGGKYADKSLALWRIADLKLRL